MVVVYGNVVDEKPEPDATFTFVKESELYQAPPPSFDGSQPSNKFTFKGEAALTTAIDYLQGGKTKTVIYFTQGHGELAFGPEGDADQGATEASARSSMRWAAATTTCGRCRSARRRKRSPPTPTSW